MSFLTGQAFEEMSAKKSIKSTYHRGVTKHHNTQLKNKPRSDTKFTKAQTRGKNPIA